MSAALKQATQMKIQLSVVTGPHAGQSFNFSKPNLTLGRGPENDIVLVNDPLVSRMHARIELNNGEFDLINQSQKNGLFVQGEYVDKWKLVNDSIFQIGDTEINFQYDLGQAAVSVPRQQQKVTPNLSIAKADATQVPVPSVQGIGNAKVAVRASSAVAPNRNQPPQNYQQRPPAHPFPQTGYAQTKGLSNVQMADDKNKKIRFYALIAIVIIGAAYFVMNPTVKSKSKRPKAVLKYEDEIAVSLRSTKEVDLRKKREEDKKAKESPQIQRAEENFIKGMRDFQLGNYSRAQDFFQVVLNLIPDHALARRHLYLSKVRFDELVQAKLMLGESYYQKHNFDMCQSMYKQVMEMLQGKSSDQKYELAQRMLEKCQLASEGIQ